MPLLLKLIPWQLYAIVGLLGAFLLCWAMGDWHGRNVTEARYAKATAELRAQVAKQDAEHAQKLQSVNSASLARETDLQSRLAAALASPPGVRIVRVRDSRPSVSCAAQTAQQPDPVPASTRATESGDQGYQDLRKFTLTQGAKLEQCQGVVNDAIKAW